MSGTKVTKTKFHYINRDVKAAVASNTYNAVDIGRKHLVSRETVNAVRRAKTWPQWLRNKAEFNRRRVERAKASTYSVGPMVDSIKLNGVELSAPSIPVHSTFREDEDTVTITRSRFRNFVQLDKRVSSLEDWRGRQQEAEKAMINLALNDEPQVKRPFWSKR